MHDMNECNSMGRSEIPSAVAKIKKLYEAHIFLLSSLRVKFIMDSQIKLLWHNITLTQNSKMGVQKKTF